MSAANWIRESLTKAKIPFEEVYHSTANSAQSLAHLEHLSGHHVAKVVVVIADKQPYVLVLPASRKLMMYKVRRALRATDVRLATEEEMASFCSDCQVGAAPPLQHWNKVPVLMDVRMKVAGNILFSGGTHSDGILMQFDDWFNYVKPATADFSVSENAYYPLQFYKDEDKRHAS